MEKKADCERAIRSLTTNWARENGIQRGQTDLPSFSAFCTWLGQKGYSHYLNFRTSTGPLYDAEQWFDEELEQTWRN
ncbi:hypothetical protein [Novosphingobium sp. SG707]|uniref:hypothetical protein n=1 Tax=Novosphingobium sp. SG707 TaxID=2586996 RepID=UPI0014479E57|nr:hypothetical protein [Novosphingobium sp. SG707]NKJ02020.1 hypothetical protein [Novosphingobium sp. SG707]